MRVAPAVIIASAVSAVLIPPDAFTPSRPPTAAAIAATASTVAPPVLTAAGCAPDGKPATVAIATPGFRRS